MSCNSSYHSCSRRNFFSFSVSGLAAGSVIGAAFAQRIEAAVQGNWCECKFCTMLFFNGYSGSICPFQGRHARADQQYVLPYAVSETGNAQANWRFCKKCQSLFFDGYSGKGVCPGGSGHEAAGFNFVLSHDVETTDPHVKDWRFCRACYGLFYNKSKQNAKSCLGGNTHIAQGYNFVLPLVK